MNSFILLLFFFFKILGHFQRPKGLELPQHKRGLMGNKMNFIF